jgi:hypothetical protein
MPYLKVETLKAIGPIDIDTMDDASAPPALLSKSSSRGSSKPSYLSQMKALFSKSSNEETSPTSAMKDATSYSSSEYTESETGSEGAEVPAFGTIEYAIYKQQLRSVGKISNNTSMI